MTPTLEALARAIDERSTRLAFVDVGLRQRTGQWRLESRVPVQRAIEAFRRHDAFTDADGRVRIPLHEADSPALTDEYVLVDVTSSPAAVIVHDPGISGPRELALDTFERTYPAWRMRFWTESYPIGDTPAFLREFADEPTFYRAEQSVTGSEEERDLDTFFERVRSTVVSERDARRADGRTAFKNLSVAEFIGERGGVRGLRAGSRTVDEFGQQVVSLAIPPDHPLSGADAETVVRETSLRAGDEVAVDATGADQLPVEAELFEVDVDGFALGIYWDSARGTNAEAAFDPGSEHMFTLGKLVAGARFESIDSAIDTVERTDHSRLRYAGVGELTFGGEPPDLPDPERLNRYQTNAVLRAATAEDVLCIHSPPWTGSRRTIDHLIRLSHDAGRRVLLLAPDAADLDVLLGSGDGKNGSIDERVRSAGISLVRLDRIGNGSSEETDPAEAGVVAAPIDRVGSLPDHEFDLAIVDQAARIGVPGGAVPFAKAGRVVLVGDPDQSPRSPLEREIDTPLQPSIFEHLVEAYGDVCIERLRCQYRMNQAIALFPNRTFYDGSLIHGQRNRTWSVDTAAPIEVVHVDGREQGTPTGSIYNEAEVQAVREEVRALLDRGLTADNIGVITPYSAQIGKVRVALDEEREGLGDRVAVGDIDRFRCRHRDAVIVSTVRTSPPTEWAREDRDPFWTGRGLNVAMTRACKRLLFVGDWRTLEARHTVLGRDDAFATLAGFLADRGLLDGLLE